MLGFNGHPPLGVNATEERRARELRRLAQFQWAPTLGGECYYTLPNKQRISVVWVSMGTHPWG